MLLIINESLTQSFEALYYKVLNKKSFYGIIGYFFYICSDFRE